MNSPTRSLVTILGVLTLAGCGIDLNGVRATEPVRTVGVIGVEGHDTTERERDDEEVAFIYQPPPLEAPDSVTRGAAFPVRVTTIGDGCTTEGEVEVVSDGNVVEIIAYDYQRGGMCTAQAIFFRRELQLRLEEAGEAIVRLYGRRIADGVELPDRVSVEKRVIVR